MKAGDDAWWEVVRTSPMYEAEAMLKSYRSTLLAEHPVGSAGYAAVGVQIARINDEIHRFAQVQNRARLSQAIRNVCGSEVFEQVMEEAARLEYMARPKFSVGDWRAA